MYVPRYTMMYVNTDVCMFIETLLSYCVCHSSAADSARYIVHAFFVSCCTVLLILLALS